LAASSSCFKATSKGFIVLLVLGSDITILRKKSGVFKC
jgi:hypothetical protein